MRRRGDRRVSDGGTHFLAVVCKRWYRAALAAEPPGVYVACLGIGGVLATGREALAHMRTPSSLDAALTAPPTSGAMWRGASSAALAPASPRSARKRTTLTSPNKARQEPAPGSSQAAATPAIEVFCASARPACRREIPMLLSRDHSPRICWVAMGPAGLAAASGGLTWETQMDRIHRRVAEGTLVERCEVQRRRHATVCRGPLAALAPLPGIAQLPDRAYLSLATYRLRLAGRGVDGACQLSTTPHRRSAVPQ